MNQSEKLKKYSDEIPEEVKSMLKAISHDARLGILVFLLNVGRMTFNEMKETLGLDSSTLSHHITILQDGNLVKNQLEKKKGRIFSYYDVTEIPEKLIGSIFDVAFGSHNNDEYTKPKSRKDYLNELPHQETIAKEEILNEVFKLVDRVNSSRVRELKTTTRTNV